MVSKTLIVGLENSSEARPIAVLVQIASRYTSTIYIIAGSSMVNAKSIMGMMGIGLRNGGQITVTAEGIDESAALEDIERYLKAR